MASNVESLTIRPGTTLDEEFEYRDKSTGENLPVDLTGCEAVGHIRANVLSTDVLLELSTANNRIRLGGATGRVRLVIPDDITATVNWKQAVYDVKIVFPDGSVDLFISGPVQVSRVVTRN